MKTRKCLNCGVPLSLTKDQVELEETFLKGNPEFELPVWCAKCEKKLKKKKLDIVNFIYDILSVLIGLGILALVINLGEKSPNLFAKIISNLNLLSYLTLNIGVGFLSSLLFVVLLENFHPGGHSIDKLHQWVYKDTKTKHRDATKRDVYEHYHGYGSWEKKTKSEWQTIRIIGFIFAGVGGFVVALLKGKAYNIPIVFLAGVIGVLIYILIQKLLDVEFLTYDNSSNSLQPVNMDFSNLFKGETSGSMLYYWIAFIIIFIFCIVVSIYWLIYFFILHKGSTILNPPLIQLYTITLRLMGILILFLLLEWILLKQKERKAKN